MSWRSGLLGVHAATADRLRVSNSRLDSNNVELLQQRPGLRRDQGRAVRGSSRSRTTPVSHNLGQGYWSDVSVYDTRVLNSNIVGNSAAGVFLEISARGTVATDRITDNRGDGVKINNTSTVTIYNNTVVRNGRALNIVQDPRTPANTSYGDDTRYPNDPEMTWLVGPVTVRNNVIGLPTSSAVCVLCVEDYSHLRTAAQMGVTSNGNVFNRAAGKTSQWLTVWSRGTININPAVYTTLPTHRSGTAQDGTSLAYESAAVVATNGTLSSTGGPSPRPWPRRCRAPSPPSSASRPARASSECSAAADAPLPAVGDGGPLAVTLARAATPHGEVVLRRRGPVLELVVDGAFAMDTVDTSTEVALAERALARHPSPGHVLVGGGGLGMTTRAVLADPRVVRTDVVELAAPLVAWARAGLVPDLAGLEGERCLLHVADVLDVLAGRAGPQGPWDVVLLDVDNGPDFLVHSSNAPLYAPPALAAARRALAPGGLLVVLVLPPGPVPPGRPCARSPTAATPCPRTSSRWSGTGAPSATRSTRSPALRAC